jgi:hypothetical protein
MNKHKKCTNFIFPADFSNLITKNINICFVFVLSVLTTKIALGHA